MVGETRAVPKKVVQCLAGMPTKVTLRVLKLSGAEKGVPVPHTSSFELLQVGGGPRVEVVAGAGGCKRVDFKEIGVVFAGTSSSGSSRSGGEEPGGGLDVLISTTGEGDGGFVVFYDVEVFVTGSTKHIYMAD